MPDNTRKSSTTVDREEMYRELTYVPTEPDRKDAFWPEDTVVDTISDKAEAHYAKVAAAVSDSIVDAEYEELDEDTVTEEINSERKEVIKALIQHRKDEWRCKKCGSADHQNKKDYSLCDTCAAAISQNTSVAIRTNSDWIEQAEALGIALFERQPEETDTEWRIWCKYRSYYPLKLPTYSELAKAVGSATATVVKAAQRWSYKVRLIAWARYTDAGIQQSRIEAIKEMNVKQLSMAQTMQEKLQTAIEAIDPATLKPNEIVNMFKMATELERKVTTYVEEHVENSIDTEAQAQSHALTKPDNMAEVLDILKGAGMFDASNSSIGIEQTTRVVVRKDDA